MLIPKTVKSIQLKQQRLPFKDYFSGEVIFNDKKQPITVLISKFVKYKSTYWLNTKLFSRKVA